MQYTYAYMHITVLLYTMHIRISTKYIYMYPLWTVDFSFPLHVLQGLLLVLVFEYSIYPDSYNCRVNTVSLVFVENEIIRGRNHVIIIIDTWKIVETHHKLTLIYQYYQKLPTG